MAAYFTNDNMAISLNGIALGWEERVDLDTLPIGTVISNPSGLVLVRGQGHLTNREVFILGGETIFQGLDQYGQYLNS